MTALVVNLPATLTRARLERLAVEHAALLEYDGHVSDDTNRLVVNMLRHEHTDYDADQTAERHRQACEQIAAQFPWLADECALQVARRSISEASTREDLAAYVAHVKAVKLERQRTVIASRAAIKALDVGMAVRFKIKGHDRCGVLVKIGRSKVTVKYEIRTGHDRDRSAEVYAALVVPA